MTSFCVCISEKLRNIFYETSGNLVLFIPLYLSDFRHLTQQKQKKTCYYY